jgi:hypothetical protein
MAYIFMQRSPHQAEVGLPLAKRLPPNPHLQAVTPAAAWERLHEPVSPTDDDEWYPARKTLLHRLLACDQRSFLTGAAGPDLQAAHIINAVREGGRRKSDVVSVSSLLEYNVSYSLSGKSSYPAAPSCPLVITFSVGRPY